MPSEFIGVQIIFSASKVAALILIATKQSKDVRNRAE